MTGNVVAQADPAPGVPAPVAPGYVVIPPGGSGSFTLTGADWADPESSLTISLTVPGNGTVLSLLAPAPLQSGAGLSLPAAIQGLSGPAPLVVTYTPTAGFTGVDSFSFTVTNSNGGSSVSVTVLMVVSDGADSDGDTLPDVLETFLSYNPNDSDSDDDGLSDVQEDYDGDGIVDSGETDPMDPDTNDDVFCDGPRADNDGDGILPADPCGGQAVVYVNGTVVGGSGDGSSWANAFTTVQTAVDAAAAGQQVWVAEGTYKAASATAAVLTMKDGVRIYGSFMAGDPILAVRSGTRAATVLSGDFDSSGTATANDSWHVAVGASNARLDGFTVTRGNAVGGGNDSNGGGMYNAGVSGLSVANVEFGGNSAVGAGGGVANNFASLTLIQVTLAGNSAVSGGGGMYNYFTSSTTLIQVTFTGNSASSGAGGGILNDSSTMTSNQVTFSSNTATLQGGGVFNTSSSATLDQVTFSDNSATSDGGGMFIDGTPSPALSQVIFSRNSAGIGGGGMYSTQSSPTLTRVTFSGNTTASSNGGGMHNFQSSPTLTQVTFIGNTASTNGGGVYNSDSSPTLTQVSFVGNSATMNNGGGMLNSSASSPTLTQVSFFGNQAEGSVSNGGGLYNSGSSPTLTDVSFVGNSAVNIGGGMANTSTSSPTLTQVTVAGNSANIGAGIGNAQTSSPALVNSAFWGNTGGGPDIANISGTPTVSNSCSQQDLTSFDLNNTTLAATDPFETTLVASGEVFLNQGVVGCVDIGDDAAAPAGWEDLSTDFAGELDTTPVDAGRHYSSAQPLVLTLTAGASNLSWTTRAASSCAVFNDLDATWIQVPAAQLPDGALAHGRGTGAVLSLVCYGAAGSPAAARGTVP